MGDYLKLYNNLDVCLLNDVLINFKKIVKENYKLELLHFLRLPQLSMTAMLKMRKDRGSEPIKLITDEKLYERCEKSIRGGISIVPNNYAKSNNKYINENGTLKRIERRNPYS